MPTYIFSCPKCLTSIEVKKSMLDIKLGDDIKAECGECFSDMTRDYEAEFSTHSVTVESNKLKAPTLGQNATDDRKRKAARIQAEIANEPFSSTSEMKEATDIAKEYEKSKEMAEGTVLGGRKAPNTKEEKEAIKIRDTKKKNEQRKMRGIHS